MGTYIRDDATLAGRSPRIFKLLNRSYGSTLVKIGVHYVPRRSLILALSESLILLVSLLAATWLRFPHRHAATEFLADPRNWLRFAVVTAVCQLAIYYNELYEVRTARSRGVQIVRSFTAMGIALLGLSLLYYFAPDIRLERGIAGLAILLSLVLVISLRLLLEKARIFKHPLERILVLGTGKHGFSVAGEILRRPELQYKVVGFLDECGSCAEKLRVTPSIIGSIGEVDDVVAREHVDRVVISLTERRGLMPLQQLATLRLQGLPIEDAHSVYERLTGRIMLDDLQPSWLIMSDGFRKSRLVLALKRTTDIMISLSLLVVTLPLMVAVAAAICLESRGPILFRQLRVGLGGRTFEVLKFRSMKTGSDKGTPSWTSDRDPRITRVGAWIRKFRIDELPQLMNILAGEMSVVGPRPEVPYFCDILEQEIPFFNLRHTVRPGLTGWAQVKYRYGASLEQAKVKFEFDLFYIKNLSVLLDLAIILETAKVVLLGRGAK